METGGQPSESAANPERLDEMSRQVQQARWWTYACAAIGMLAGLTLVMAMIWLQIRPQTPPKIEPNGFRPIDLDTTAFFVIPVSVLIMTASLVGFVICREFWLHAKRRRRLAGQAIRALADDTTIPAGQLADLPSEPRLREWNARFSTFRWAAALLLVWLGRRFLPSFTTLALLELGLMENPINVGAIFSFGVILFLLIGFLASSARWLLAIRSRRKVEAEQSLPPFSS